MCIDIQNVLFEKIESLTSSFNEKTQYNILKNQWYITFGNKIVLTCFVFYPASPKIFK